MKTLFFKKDVLHTDSNFVKKVFPFFIFIVFVFSFTKSYAQTIVIDSTALNGGNFESPLSTFVGTGWTAVNAATNRWFIGTASFCTGAKGLFIGTATVNNNYTITTANTSHVYRSVTFPAGQGCIRLSFNWKGNGEVGYDDLRVYLGAVGGPIPVANTTFTTTDVGAAQVAGPYDIQTTCGRVQVTIPAAYAGTTRYLVLSWQNDNSGGGAVGSTVDNLGLIAANFTAPTCATATVPANLATGITKCNPIISWTAPTGTVCNAPTKYLVYFGTATNPPLVDSTFSLSYTLGLLSSSTTYYWKIVPKNAIGPATGCVESSFTTSAVACPASPGGVGLANITAWFKADALTAGSLTSWTTTHPSGGGAITVTDPSAPYAVVTNGSLASTNFFNYNQYISFANNDVTAGNERYLYTTANLNLMTNSNNAADQSSFFSAYGTNPANSAPSVNDAIVYWGPASGNYGLQCRGFARMAIGSGLGLTLLSARDANPVNANASIFSYTGNRSTTTSMNGYYNGAPLVAGLASESQGGTGLSIGAHLATNTPTFIEPFQGGQGENVFYNTTLSPLSVNKVHTYLAIKYGVALNSNYTASNNGTIFTTAAPFNNNIIGLGRDDASGLIQKQSHNADDSVRFYINSLAGTNAANAGNFPSDYSFLMTGATTGQLNATPASNAVKPASIYSRLEREWKVTKTNLGQSFSMDVKLSLSAAAVTPLDLRLLVDNTGNFANALVFAAGGGLTFSFNYPIITVSGISATQIPDNSTWNITIGSVSAATPLPAELISFTGKTENNQTAKLNWTTTCDEQLDKTIIERSFDGTNFMQLRKVDAVKTTNKTINWNYTDITIPTGIDKVYYRLQVISPSGTQKTSDVITLVIKNQATTIELFPNPVKDALQFTVTSVKTQKGKAFIISPSGKVMIMHNLSVIEGVNNVKYLDTQRLPNGIYYLNISFGKELITKKFKIVK